MKTGCGCFVLVWGLVNLVFFLVEIFYAATGRADFSIALLLILLFFLVNGGLLLVFGWQAVKGGEGGGLWPKLLSLIYGGSKESEEGEGAEEGEEAEKGEKAKESKES